MGWQRGLKRSRASPAADSAPRLFTALQQELAGCAGIREAAAKGPFADAAVTVEVGPRLLTIGTSWRSGPKGPGRGAGHRRRWPRGCGHRDRRADGRRGDPGSRGAPRRGAGGLLVRDPRGLARHDRQVRARVAGSGTRSGGRSSRPRRCRTSWARICSRRSPTWSSPFQELRLAERRGGRAGAVLDDAGRASAA